MAEAKSRKCPILFIRFEDLVINPRPSLENLMKFMLAWSLQVVSGSRGVLPSCVSLASRVMTSAMSSLRLSMYEMLIGLIRSFQNTSLSNQPEIPSNF